MNTIVMTKLEKQLLKALGDVLTILDEMGDVYEIEKSIDGEHGQKFDIDKFEAAEALYERLSKQAA